MNLPGQYFRAGVGAVITNDQGHVLTFERSDIPGAWQLPQGGLEKGEEPLPAVLREIMEETGISREKLRLLGSYPAPLVYELPLESRSAKTGLGQVEYWFIFRYLGRDADIRLPEGGEMRAWQWMPFDEVVSNAVNFRQPMYRRLHDYFETLRATDKR